jgi:hypothetical protein
VASSTGDAVKQVELGERQSDWLVRSIGARLPVHCAVRSATLGDLTITRAPGRRYRSAAVGWLARSTDEIADNRKGLIGLVAEHAVSSVWKDLES